MSFDLLNIRKQHVKLSHITWAKLLDLAIMYGWSPMGTEMLPSFSNGEEWDGSYGKNSYQLMLPDDLNNFADALERSIPDLPPVAHKDSGPVPVNADTVADLRSRVEGMEGMAGEIIKYFVLSSLDTFDNIASSAKAFTEDAFKPGDVVGVSKETGANMLLMAKGKKEDLPYNLEGAENIEGTAIGCNPFLPTLSWWGGEQEHLKGLIRYFRSSPEGVVIF